MPIEFRCDQCNKLLRVPDDTAGKKARCPGCSAIVEIPAAPARGTAPAQPAAPQSGGLTGPPPPPGYQPGGQPGSPFAPGVNPYQSPSAYSTERAQAGYAPTAAAGSTRLDFGDVFSRTFTIFGRQWANCVLAALVVLMVGGGAMALAGVAAAIAGEATHDEGVFTLVMIVGMLVAYIVFFWVTVGQAIFFLKIARGREATVGDLFAGGPFYLTALGATILYALICFGGFLLCVIPGYIFLLMFSQYLFLIVDRDLGVMDSLTVSKEITDGNKLMIFAIQLVAGLVGQMLGYATCMLGLLVVVPFMMLLNAVMYLIMTGRPTGDRVWSPQPPQHAPHATS